MTSITAKCDAIIDEAGKIRTYSEKVEAMLQNGDGKSAELFDSLRIDAMTALSKLTVALSEEFYESPIPINEREEERN